MDNKDTTILNIIDTFQKVLSKPETFLSPQESFTKNIRHLLKNTYDLAKKEEHKTTRSNALPELIIENFDSEQIWQQIELQNDEVLDKSIANVSRLAVAKSRLVFQDAKQDDSSESHVSSNEDNDNNDDKLEENESDEEVDDVNEEEKESNDIGADHPEDKRKFKQSVVDDEFFQLDEMNNFLVSEEKKLNKKDKKSSADDDDDSESEGSVNMFEAGSENDEEEGDDFEGNDKLRNPRYKDFFGTKTQQIMEKEQRIMQQYGIKTLDVEEDKEDLEKSDDEEAEDGIANLGENESDVEDKNKPKSTLELREQRLKSKIKEIEEAAVGEKPWQLKGEVTAGSRPENSLLQEVLEFDLTTRPAPVITEETTHLLEDVIRQRIKDKTFDDVERKEKPVENVLEYKKQLLLDQEKSKESLAQIYEKEYVQQRDAMDEAEKEEADPAIHKEIKTMMHSLFTKLDALSNYHFTPKPAAPELKVVSNLPAITMEEVAPIASSDTTLLAPEEIKRKNKGDIIGKGERTVTDKKRERRQKKCKQREHAKEKEKREKTIQKLKPGLGNKYSKEKARKMLERISKDKNVDKMDESLGAKSIKSSAAFFTQLQDDVKQQIRSKSSNKASKSNNKINAKRIKL